jgi:hypothetical protein
LGLPQECVGVAYEALKASGLISQPAEATLHIGDIQARPANFATDPYFAALDESVVAIRTQLEEAHAFWDTIRTAIPLLLRSGAGATIRARSTR